MSISKTSLNRTLFLLTACILFVACKQQADTSRTLVVDGKIIQETDKPAVVQISAKIDAMYSSSCSATWVSHNTIVTAAHCIWENGILLSEVRVARGVGTGAKAIKVLSHPMYQRGSSRIDSYDVAVLVFPDNSSTEFISVAPVVPARGDVISIVGYGKFDHKIDTSGGKKRIGNNKLQSVDSQGRLNFTGTLRPTLVDGTGENVTNSQGDSGGPMLFKDKIIGISSSVTTPSAGDTTMDGHYENLRHPPIESWLKSLTTTNGAIIRGLTGDDPVGTPVAEVASVFVLAKNDASSGKLELQFAAAAGAKKLQFTKYDSLDAMKADTAADLANAATFVEVKGTRAFFGASLDTPSAAAFMKIRVLDEAGKTLIERKIKLSPL